MGLFDAFKRTPLQLNQPMDSSFYRWLGSFTPLSFSRSTDKLLKHGYEENIDVYSVFKKIVDVYNDIPYIVEKRTAEGWEEVEDTTLHELLDKPNKTKQYSFNDIDERLIIYLLATGNSYLVGEKGFGSKILEVDVLPSQFVDVQTGQDFFLPNPKFKFNLGSTHRTYTQEEIEHIMLFNPSFTGLQESYCGLSVIQVAARAVQVGNDRWDADANLLQNRGAMGLITDGSQRPMTPEEAKIVQSAWDVENNGTSKFGKIKVTNKDLKYIPMGMSSTDLQLLEKGVVTTRNICNVLGLDSSLFNDPANKTFNNRQEAEKAMYTNCIMPIANRIVDNHNLYLALNHYPDGSVRLRKDFENVEALQRDKKAEAEKDKIVMEGMNVVLNMPISNEAKIALLTDNYELPKEIAAMLLKDIDNEGPADIQD